MAAASGSLRQPQAQKHNTNPYFGLKDSACRQYNLRLSNVNQHGSPSPGSQAAKLCSRGGKLSDRGWSCHSHPRGSHHPAPSTMHTRRWMRMIVGNVGTKRLASWSLVKG